MNRTNALMIGLILVLAAGLRSFNIDAHGFWTDEFCSLSDAMGWGLQLDRVPLNQPVPPLPVCTRLLTSRPIGEMVPAISRSDVHPPIYFVLLRIWMDCFGDSETAARSLGVVIALAGIAGLFSAALISVGPGAALRSSLVAAVAASWIEFSQEVRNYLLAATLVVAASWCLLKVERNPTPRAAACLTLTLLLLPLTHYYAAASAAAICLHGLIQFRGPARRAVAKAAVVSASLFLICWGPSLVHQLDHLGEHNYWLKDDGSGRLGRCVERICRLPVRYLVDTETFGLPSSVSAVLGGLMLMWLAVLYWRRPDLRLWVLLAAAPVVQIAVLDLVGKTAGSAWVRYSLMASPGFFVLIGSAIKSGRWSALPAGIAVVASMLSLQTAYTPVWKVNDFRVWASFADRTLRPGDALVVTGLDPIGSSINLAAFQHYMPRLPDPAVVLTEPASPAVLSRLRRCRQILVVADSRGQSPQALLPGFVSQSSQKSGDTVTIYLGHLSESPIGALP